MKLLNKISVSKIKKLLIESKYLKYFTKLDVVDNVILLESQHGRSVNGNIFYILSELNNNIEYENFEIYLTVNKSSINKIEMILHKYNLKCNLVLIHTKEYYKLVSTAKYLINDNTFPSFFIKKDKQIYLNTWHGTPLKTLGKNMNVDYHNIGNAQKNFLLADYILYPNEFTMRHISRDYMINDLSSAKSILAEYPRNEAFTYDNCQEIKERLKIDDKKIYSYLPTWRGTVSKIDTKSLVYIKYFLYEIDKKLNDDEIVYVNFHALINDEIDYSHYNHIREFPENYETYDFLKISDVLITDYSSVMIDYSHTGKKCVLFAYDLDEYIQDRGLYIELEKLPFPIVKDVDSLINELRNPVIKYNNEYKKIFIPNNLNKITKNILEYVILNKPPKFKVFKSETTKKENILICVGNLSRNGLTTSILNLLNNINLKKRNYYITFSAKDVSKYNYVLKTMPKEVKYISINGKTNLSIFQKIVMKLYEKNIITYNIFYLFLKKAYKQELKRVFGFAKFNHVIHYTGYEYKKMTLFSQFDCPKTMYIHNDINKEIKNKRTKPKHLYNKLFKIYDNIAVVTEDMIRPTQKFLDSENNHKIAVNPNLIDYNNIVEKSKEKIEFDFDTESTISLNLLNEILNNKSLYKFITIGRFSKEKGHNRLIQAFNKFWKKNPNCYLIIIGGHGNLYNQTLELIKNSPSNNNIIIIKSISNPFAILKQCNYFILSSFYEGFGLVLAEADILGLPVISTDIPGPKIFMEKNNGKLVENSENGIYQGLIKLYDGKIKAMNVDYEKYNEDAIEQFENLFR